MESLLLTTALHYQQTYQHEKSNKPNKNIKSRDLKKTEVYMCQTKQDSMHASRFPALKEEETNSTEQGLAAALPFPLKKIMSIDSTCILEN